MSGKIRLMKEGLWPLINRITRENELSPDERLILLNLIGRAGNSGEAFPSQETLASDTGMSLRQVQRVVSSLSKSGFISKERRGFGLGNVYRLEEDFLLEWVDSTEHSRQMDESFPPDLRDSSATEAGVTTNIQEGRKDEGRKPAGKPPRVSPSGLAEQKVREEFSFVPGIDKLLLLARSSPTFQYAKAGDKEAVLRVLVEKRISWEQPKSRAIPATNALELPPNPEYEWLSWTPEEAKAKGYILG